MKGSQAEALAGSQDAGLRFPLMALFIMLTSRGSASCFQVEKRENGPKYVGRWIHANTTLCEPVRSGYPQIATTQGYVPH
jgi:hypothetical protein